MIDFNLHEGAETISDPADYVLQQIEILFDTTPGDLLGDTSYGTNYAHYLYELKLSEDQLQEVVLSDLYNIDLCGYEPLVEVYLTQGTERDIALINMTLQAPSGAQVNKTYKIV